MADRPLQGGLESLWRLARLQNIALPSLIIVATYFASDHASREARSIWPLVLSIAAYIALHTLVTIWNDIRDADVDALNNTPRYEQAVASGHKPFIVGGLSACVVTAIACMWSLPIYTHVCLLVFLVVGWLYNNPPVQTSRKPLASQVSLLTAYGLLPALIGITLGNSYTLATLTLGASLAIARGSLSLLKDYKDAAGDAKGGKKTFLLVYGGKRTAQLSVLAATIGYIGTILSLTVIIPNNRLTTVALITVGAWLIGQRARLLKHQAYQDLNRIFHNCLRYEVLFVGLAAVCLYLY